MKKFLSALILILFILTSINVKAASVPDLQMVTQPKTEYTDGDRISFTVNSPNYSGKVEYRVILWNGTTKTQSELWKTPVTGYYYKKWQPAGNYKFNINWPVKGMEPGAYSLTVLVRRVGAKVTYDSNVKTNTFWVKPKVNIDSNFIGDGTEKRVDSIVKDNHGYSIRAEKGGKFYYCGNISLKSYSFSYGIYNEIHETIIKLIDREELPYLCFDSKEYPMLLGTIPRDYDLRLKSMKKSGVFDDKPHNFDTYIYEVFYDVKNDEYYLANEEAIDVMGGIAKLKQNNKGEVPKFVAVVIQIADF